MKRRLLFFAFSIISVFVLAFSFSNQNVEFNSNTTIRDIEVSQEIKKEDCMSFAPLWSDIFGDYDPSDYTGGGGGLGNYVSTDALVAGGTILTGGLLYAGAEAVVNTSQSHGSSYIPNSSVNTNSVAVPNNKVAVHSFDSIFSGDNPFDVDDSNFSEEVKKKLDELKKEFEELKKKYGFEAAMKMLESVIGTTALRELEKNQRNKTICIGRDMTAVKKQDDDQIKKIDSYDVVAAALGAFSFYTEDFNKVVQSNEDWYLFKLANILLVEYCCKNDYNFIIVTDPYFYVYPNIDLRYGGGSYVMELLLLQINNYYDLKDKSGRNISWENLPIPKDDTERSHYETVNYTAKKGA